MAVSARATGIEAGAVYTQTEFCERMGLGRKAFVEARRNGLPVRKVSRRLYVDSNEAREWLKSQPKLSPATA